MIDSIFIIWDLKKRDMPYMVYQPLKVPKASHGDRLKLYWLEDRELYLLLEIFAWRYKIR